MRRGHGMAHFVKQATLRPPIERYIQRAAHAAGLPSALRCLRTVSDQGHDEQTSDWLRRVEACDDVEAVTRELRREVERLRSKP